MSHALTRLEISFIEATCFDIPAVSIDTSRPAMVNLDNKYSLAVLFESLVSVSHLMFEWRLAKYSMRSGLNSMPPSPMKTVRPSKLASFAALAILSIASWNTCSSYLPIIPSLGPNRQFVFEANLSLAC